MDIVKISQTYVQKMINNTPGMKIMLLDDNTVKILYNFFYLIIIIYIYLK